ncbi:MAG: hypothetical protein FJZ90_16535, partial [Chloroflexi bacterium]|nr:hypothetical protein [Chloroflexota bacterium]
MRLRDQATWVILGAAVIAALALPWLFGAVWPNRHLIAALMRQQMATRLPSNEEAPSVTRGPTLSSGSGALVSEANLLATATPTTTRPTTSAQEWAFPLIFRQVPTPTHTPTPTKTRKPTPTPTPTLPWPEPLDKPPRSKLGLHVQWNNSPEIMEYVRRMKPAVVKSVGDYGFLAEVKEVSPTTLTLARTDRDQRMEGDPIAAARAYVAADLETYRRHPEVDYWEGINEPVVRGRVEWFAAFEAERVRAMAEHGLRTAIGAFSAGVPEWEDFVAFLPAVEAAKKHGGILTVHEYDAPDMARSIGAGL